MNVNRATSLRPTGRAAWLVTAVAVLLAGGELMPSLVDAAGGQQRAEPVPPCHSETWQSSSAIAPLVGPYDARLRLRVDRAVTLFRFGRVPEALRKLETAVDMVTEIVDSRVSPEQRTRAVTRIQKLQACLKTAPVPALATLIVRPLPPDDERRRLGNKPIADAYVRVDELLVGQTGRNGTLRVQVPSGAITVRALIPPSSLGERQITVAPGSSTTIRIALDDDKEVGELSLMTLAEAVEDVIPAGTPSLTFRFATDDGPAHVTRVSQVDLLDPAGNFVRDLTDLFHVVGGAVVARDAPSLMKTLRRDGEAKLRVVAWDAKEFFHSDTITFRIR
jgi:hypothetical protein